MLKALVHILGGRTASGFPNNFSRDASNSDMRWHVFHHNAAGANLSPFTDVDIADDRSRCANQYTMSYFRVTVTLYLTCAAQRNTVKYGDIVFNDGSFTNHYARGMVEHNAAANAGGRVNIGAENSAHLILEIKRQAVPFLLP